MGVWLDSSIPPPRLVRDMRAAWGKPGHNDPWLADRYFHLAQASNDLQRVDDRTWADLEFPRIFADLDTTITRIGSQCLFRQMRMYLQESDRLAMRLESFRALRRDQGLREKSQLALTPLNADSAARAVETRYEPRIEGPEYPGLILTWSVILVSLIGAIVMSLVPFPAMVPLLLVNVVISASTASRRRRPSQACVSART